VSVLLRLALMCFCVGASVAQSANGYVVAGVVVDELSQRPVGGARLMLMASRSGPESRKVMIAGGDGRFRFSGLSAGKYDLMASADGYPEQGWNAREQYVTAVVAGAAKDSEHVVFGLKREAGISGTVRDEAGEPVREAQVGVFRKAWVNGAERVEMGAFGQTDDRGRYEIRKLPPGQYFVAVSASAWYANAMSGGDGPQELDVVYPVTFYGGATEERAATPIQLQAGARMEADVTLFPTRALRVSFPSSWMEQGRLIHLQRRIFNIWGVPTMGGVNGRGDGVSFVNGLDPGE